MMRRNAGHQRPRTVPDPKLQLGAVTPSPSIVWQPSLFAGFHDVGIDRSYSGLQRVHLDDEAWVDHCPGWLRGADRLFEEVLAARDWGQRSRRMYDQRVVEPRLTSTWNLGSGEPLEPGVLEEVREALSERYGRTFDSAGFNLYRDGRDSVAWHGDRIAKEIDDPIVALISLGEPRRFLLRPKGGGRSRTFLLGGGDLLVTGGTTQRTWDHSVPKVRQAGPRISIAFRHDLDPAVYAGKRAEPEPTLRSGGDG
jgi:alkylated DNA repair dioxygenase AlkB